MARGSVPIRQLTPGRPLSEFVDCFWIHEGYTQPHARERVLPTGTMDLIFGLQPDGRATSSVVGARSGSVVLDTSRPFSAIGIHFKPGGGFPFFGVPSSELHNQSVTLDSVWGRYATTITDRLWEADTPEQQFGILQEALREKARDRFNHHPAVGYALDLIERSNGARLVGDVVQRIGMSPRRFLDVFQNQVGLSPKVFCRIRRFTAVLRRIERAADVDWVDVALSCGYFDQAHFNHDFRAFSGLRPSDYLRDHTSRTHVAIND